MNNVHSWVDIYGWQVFLTLFFLLYFLKLFISTLFSQTKNINQESSEENILSCYQVIIYVQRDYKYFYLFFIVSKVAHLSNLNLAIIISSWLFTDPYARIGPS